MLYYQHAHVFTIWVDPVVMQIPGSPLLVDIRLCISCRHLLHYTHSTPSLKKQTAARLQESCISATWIDSDHQYYQLPAGYRTFALWVDISDLTFLKVTASIHVRVYRGMLLIFLYDLYVSWWTIFTAGSRSELPSMCWLSDAKAPTNQFPECESISPMWAHSNISWQIPGLF